MDWRHLVILFVCFVSLSDAEVSISTLNTLGEDGSIECGSQVILMCKIQSFAGTMSWKADNTTMMSCISGSCRTHPPYHPNYGFAFDRVNGVFNITINPVTFSEDKKQFECNDGSASQFFTASVKVLPDNRTTVLSSTDITNGTNSTDNTNTTEGTEIKVTTGCMYPAENVQFQWYFFKEGETPVLYNDGQQTDGSTNGSTTDCTAGDCGGDGVKQMTSVLTFKQDSDGEDYYIQAVVTIQIPLIN
ncbi:uncharacterized protein LOC123527291 [Mercenaria mercenaria]|uniref:uncharacterized protein LOC123527291 n=1 Tax=Mercenaria mercenaria TaxID=6596 RepID=UPI00234ED113|nr:uncharacterized protein LOC123527291 [Mercenaria mercenaria]XP_045162598.2 uncharacterized protein LOC123527291 [Mercenaria mercenaria]